MEQFQQMQSFMWLLIIGAAVILGSLKLVFKALFRKRSK